MATDYLALVQKIYKDRAINTTISLTIIVTSNAFAAMTKAEDAIRRLGEALRNKEM